MVVGDVIGGRYTLERKLGEGGFGETWLARGSADRVVVKVARSAQAEIGAYEREIAALRSMAAPMPRQGNHGIRPLLDVGAHTDNRPFLVYPWVEGQTLAEALAKASTLPLVRALEVARGLADGLALLHPRGLLHRDIKPSNVLLPTDAARYGPAILLDFGLAGFVRRATGTTMAGEVFGTPYYMSPEQLVARPQSPAADVYGLGVVLYEMLYGHRPFEGENLAELAFKVIQQPVAFDASAVVPHSVQAFIARCLEKDAAQRPKDGEAARASLDILLQQVTGAPQPSPFVTPPPPQWPGAAVPGFGLPPPGGIPMGAAPAAGYGGPPQPSPPLVAVPVPFAGPFPKAVALPDMATAAGAARTADDTGAVAAMPASPSRLPMLLGIGGAVTATAGFAVAVRGGWYSVIGGVLLVAAGLLASQALRVVIDARKNPLARQSDVLRGRTMSRVELSQSIAIDLATLIERCKDADDRILGQSVALMLTEYSEAKAFDDRQKALMNATQLLDKLRVRLSPWYVRNEKLLPTVVGIVGIASAIVTTVMGLLGKK